MNPARLLIGGLLVAALFVASAGHIPLGVVERVTAGQAASDTDGDGIPDPLAPGDPQPGEDFCPALAEDADGKDDGDGCPDSDVWVEVVKEEQYTVTVSQPQSKTVDIWINNGNYPADILVHMLAVSTIGACEVMPVAEPGDEDMWVTADEDGDTIVETLQFLLEWEFSAGAGQSIHTTRNYEISCLVPGNHTFELQVDAIPLLPVEEEDVMDLRNTHKNFPSVTAVEGTIQDVDGDGFLNADEGFIGTDAQVACYDGQGLPDWPPDFNNDRRASLGDILRLVPIFNSAAPGPPYSPRFDLNTDDRVSLPDALMFIPYINDTCSGY